MISHLICTQLRRLSRISKGIKIRFSSWSSRWKTK